MLEEAKRLKNVVRKGVSETFADDIDSDSNLTHTKAVDPDSLEGMLYIRDQIFNPTTTQIV